MRYKVGDTVKFRDDLDVNWWYGGIQFLSGMRNLRGQSAVIHKISENGHFKVCGSAFWYDEKMLEEPPPCDPVSLDISELL